MTKEVKNKTRAKTRTGKAVLKTKKRDLPTDGESQQPESRPATQMRRAETTRPPEKKARRPSPRRKFFWLWGLKEGQDALIDNLTMLLAAGMDILSALEAVKSEVGSWRLRRLIDFLRFEIDSGLTLWEAMERTKVFSQQSISLIRIGEQSGRLVENLKVIVAQQQKDKNFRSKIRSAMMYPAFVLFVTLVVGLGIAWFILPRLSVVFSSLDVELPLVTRILIDLGKFVSLYGYVVIPSTIVGLLIFGYLLFIFKPTRFLGQTISRHTPGIKKLVLQTEMARLGYILGTLLEAGLPLVYALRSLSQTTDIRAYQKFYSFLEQSLEDGNSFRRSFTIYRKINKLIPQSIQQLIIAGEQSGSLSRSLLKIGEIYEDKIEITTKNLSVIMEPVLLFIVWLGVLAVAVAVILPIYSLVGSFNH